MELEEALLKRRSVRRFTNDPVNDSDIDKLMHAAMSGPSACNKTPWEFYVVKNPDMLEKLHAATRYTNIEAPAAIIVCGCQSRFLPEPNSSFWVQDCSAATENILLKAVELGLGTVWCGIFPQSEAVQNVRDVLKLSNDMIPLNIIYVGKPEIEPEPRDQYKDELVHIIP